MKVPHFAGAPNQLTDEIFTSDPFSELNTKVAYRIDLPKVENTLEFYAGVKNILNAYQDNFDIGKNRDSDFVFGPALPRTFFVGVKVQSK
jgi:outer membrane receptor for ferrienterochelin and colicins